VKKTIISLAVTLAFPAFGQYVPNKVIITTPPDVTVKITRNKTNTSKQISITVNKDDTVEQVKTYGWIKVASEGGSFTPPNLPAKVRYGVTGFWIEKILMAGGMCTNEFFGGDPKVGTVKTCELYTGPIAAPPIEPPTDHRAGIFVAPQNTWPTPQPGVPDERLVQTGVIPPARTGEYDGGEFRLVCNFSKMSYDDPIVYPNLPDAAHHHTFYGNTGINAFTTPANIRATGNNATCRGGIINLSGYWHPSMIDTRTGVPIAPKALLLYYKSDTWPYMNPQPPITPMPPGLRMVIGNAKNITAEATHGDFLCLMPASGSDRPGTKGKSIPTNCLAGDEIWWNIPFNQCWDGVNLDSPDHKSHMANTEFNSSSTWTPDKQYRCPVTHPVVLPKITQIVQFRLPAIPSDTKFWRLSSDVYDPSQPGGYSSHADWMNGWNPTISDLWGVECMQKKRDCGTANLGDGRVTQEFQGN